MAVKKQRKNNKKSSKKKKKRFPKDKKEKREFLRMDWVERMIRVEQSVNASFNKKVPYNKTRYYQSLTDSEKKEFEKYLKKNKRKKYLGLFLGMAFVGLVLLNGAYTGGIVSNFNYKSPENIALTFGLFLILLGLILNLTNGSKYRL